VYGGDRDYFIAMAPTTLAVKNAALVRQQKIRIICGTEDSLFAGATFVHEELTKANIPHEFIPVPESPHNHDQLLQYETFDTMAFYADVFGGGEIEEVCRRRVPPARWRLAEAEEPARWGNR
jgi:hypothetical protein